MTRRRFGARTRARSQALQLMFQAEATDRPVEVVLAGPFVVAEADGPQEVTDALDDYARRLALGADAMREVLDEVISDASRNWTLTRMPSVDRNLLRLAIFEMLEVDEVPCAVTIDESVELAKAFGTDESSRFVNGLLGRIARRIEDGVDVKAEARRAIVAAQADAAPSDAAVAQGSPEAQPEAPAGDPPEPEDTEAVSGSADGRV